MSPERWQRIQDVLVPALERAPASREAFLTEACAGDQELMAEIKSLVEAHDQAGNFLHDRPIATPPPDPPSFDEAEQMEKLVDEVLHPSAADGPAHLAHVSGGAAGQTISRYDIIERLGGGGMGVVYKARDLRLNRIVALKFLPPHLSADEEAKTRFLHEARAASGLDHVNICTIHEIGETDQGQLFIAMACYAGETLKKKVERGALLVEEALDYTLQTAHGLAMAHENGIIHRDIKPANIMVIPASRGKAFAGLVKLLDFGIAKATDMSLTKANVLMGTLAYMSPEQTRGEEVDHRTDIWSLGVVLYEMLAGFRPFQGAYDQAVIYSILNKDSEPVRELRKEVPPALERIVSGMLAKAPADRYDTIQELIRDLQLLRATSSDATVGAAAADFASPRNIDHGELLPEGERVQTTVVVSVIGGYVDLVEQLGPEELERMMRQIRERAVSIVQDHGGVVNRFTGEEIVMLFGIPTPHEDDCARAARAVLDLHAWVGGRSMEADAGPVIHLHSGIDTSLVVAQRLGREDEPFRIAGSAVQAAAALALHAEPGEVLINSESRRLLARFFETENRAPLHVRGRDEPLIPSRIVGASGLQNRLEAAARAGLTPFAGRELELITLERCLDQVRHGQGQIVTIVGEAGLGKSRLLYEFLDRLKLEEITALQGRCHTHGGATPYLPFIEVLRQHLGGDLLHDNPVEEVVARILAIDVELEKFIPYYLHLLSLQSEVYPLPEQLESEQLRIGMLEGLSAILTLSTRHRPLALLLEDWHWSDETSRDVMHNLIELIPACSLLVVVTYRPEYAHDWGHPAHQTSLRLRPLESAASVEIMKAVLQAEQFPEEVGVLLHERTGGNPFFLEEICQALREDGTLRVENGHVRLTRSIEKLQLPNTVQAVIRMRLYRLNGEVRSLLRMAAVIGREFTRALIQHVVGDEVGLTASLEALRGSGLIQQTRVLPEATYRFKHVLTQEVAYESLLQHQRKMLHGKVGEAIEALHPGAVEEQAERLAHHFGEAGRWRKAIRYGWDAARKARMVEQYAEALSMIDQAYLWITQIPEDSGRKKLLIEILLEQERLCETVGDRLRQQSIIDELLELLDPVEEPVQVANVYVRQGDLNILRGRFDEADDYLSRALQISQEQKDDELRHRALRSIGFLSWHQGKDEEALAIQWDLVALSKQRGDWLAHVHDLTSVSTLLRKRGEYEKALELVNEVLASVDELTPAHQGLLYQAAGDLYRSKGDHEQALCYLQKASELYTGLYGRRVFALISIAAIHFEQGRFEESLSMYREAVDSRRKSRDAEGLAQSLRIMGGALVALERFDEALPCLQETAAIFSRLDDAESEALVWSQIARVQERSGDYVQAAANWKKVCMLHERANVEDGQLDALEGLARAAGGQGDHGLALQYNREALALAERLDDLTRQSNLHNSIGILKWQEGAYEAALAHYEQALLICRERDDQIHAGLMLNSIGVTLSRLQRHDEAVQRLEEALELHRLTKEKLLEAHALATLGDVHMEQQRHEDARSCFGASLQLRWDLDDRRGEGWMLHRLAQVYAAQGEAERARNSAAQAAEIAEEIKDEELMKESCRLLD